MRSTFRKISRVGSLAGATKWYLSEDCLLAAKRVLYTVEYRRFYLHDLEYITVWNSRSWLWRLVIPAVVLALIGASFWAWVNSTAGTVFLGMALAWVAWEMALGPTARSRICTSGASVELSLVKRTRRARKVLAKIDAAVRATREATEQTTPAMKAPEPYLETRLEEASATTPVVAAPETNGS